jgi:hypothetical protein
LVQSSSSLVHSFVITASFLAGGTNLTLLPLPLAALISLTITYKVDKGSEAVPSLAAPALNTLGESCPWPSFLLFGFKKPNVGPTI